MSAIMTVAEVVAALRPPRSRHRDRAGITRTEKPCPLCLESRYRGQLWLRGNDYVECPDCKGSGTFVVYKQMLPPPPSRIFLLGEQAPGEIIPVELESV
jgi:hypothetical protein